jgi:hypothetical protein
MADVTIERLTITIDLDGDGAEAHFARLFECHVERWWQAECRRKADRRFAERERLLPDSAPGGAG